MKKPLKGAHVARFGACTPFHAVQVSNLGGVFIYGLPRGAGKSGLGMVWFLTIN